MLCRLCLQQYNPRFALSHRRYCRALSSNSATTTCEVCLDVVVKDGIKKHTQHFHGGLLPRRPLLPPQLPTPPLQPQEEAAQPPSSPPSLQQLPTPPLQPLEAQQPNQQPGLAPSRQDVDEKVFMGLSEEDRRQLIGQTSSKPSTCMPSPFTLKVHCVWRSLACLITQPHVMIPRARGATCGGDSHARLACHC